MRWTSLAPSTRLLAVACSVALSATLAAACSSGGKPQPSGTVTVTSTPGGSQTSAGTSSPAASSSTAGQPAGPATCPTSALRVTVGASQGTAGTIYTNIDFTNVSGTTCVMRGYPGVSLVTAGTNAGSQIGAAAVRDSTTPVTSVTLAPGHVAHAVLGVTQAANLPPAACKPVTAHWLKVYPPDQYTAAYVPFATPTCSSKSERTMRIRAIAVGA